MNRGEEMPIVQVEMLSGRSMEQKKSMVKEITDSLVRTLNCKPEAVRIIIREMEKEHYGVAGKLYCEQ